MPLTGILEVTEKASCQPRESLAPVSPCGSDQSRLELEKCVQEVVGFVIGDVVGEQRPRTTRCNALLCDEVTERHTRRHRLGEIGDIDGRR